MLFFSYYYYNIIINNNTTPPLQQPRRGDQKMNMRQIVYRTLTRQEWHSFRREQSKRQVPKEEPVHKWGETTDRAEIIESAVVTTQKYDSSAWIRLSEPKYTGWLALGKGPGSSNRTFRIDMKALTSGEVGSVQFQIHKQKKSTRRGKQYRTSYQRRLRCHVHTK